MVDSPPCRGGEDCWPGRTVSWSSTEEATSARSGGWRTDDGTYWWPALRYRYEVDGRRLTGMRWRYRYVWRFGGYSGDRAMVDQAVARYPVGKKVPVAYDPDDPSESVLEPGLFRTELVSGVIKVCFAGVFLLLMLGVAFGRVPAARARRRAREAVSVDRS